MKKLLLSLLILCVMFSLTACGDKTVTEADIETWSDEDFEKALEELDDSFTSDNEETEEVALPESKIYEAKQEIIDAGWDSGLVQIDGKLVQFPFSLSDWVAMGFDYDLGSLSKDYLYAQNNKGSVRLLVNGEQFCSYSFIKTTEGFETIEAINPIIKETGLLVTPPKNFSIFFPGGLTFGDPYQNIEEALGKPLNLSNSMVYTYGELGYSPYSLKYGLSISVNRNDQTIGSFQIGKSLDASNIEALTTITFENVPNRQTSDLHNVSLSWFPESQEPTEVFSHKAQRGGRTTIMYNNQTYFAEFIFSLTSQKYARSNEYSSYGDPLFDETDENGMRRRLYKADDNYLAVCSTDAFILEATLNLKNAMDASEDTYAVLQDFAIEFAKSIQY
ncbi:MAG: hypothetical protein IKK33_00745 [Lachnospiraceae bacterium]|nr:hypothetical protein [Lachnospiraceae bacterium]